MEQEYVCSIDQGTSSTRAMVFSKDGRVIASHQKELTQIYPQPGFVEHDPLEIWNTVVTCLSHCMYKIKNAKIVGVGITNQRETTIVWNKNTGLPYHNAIVWNDTRTSSLCENFSKISCPFTTHYGKDRLRYKTGLPISTYFSAVKLYHLLETLPQLRKDAEKGLVLFGTVDTWLIWKLSGGKIHATDVSNASRTLLMNIHTRQWDAELLSFFHIPTTILPQIRSSSEIYGKIKLSTSLELMESHDVHVKELIQKLEDVPISGVLGDQHAALFGQTCYSIGDAKCTYGTGAFLLLNTGSNVVMSNSGLLTTLAYQIGPDAPPVYALEGSVAYCGSTIQWLRDNLGIIKHVAESEKLAAEVSDNGGVYFIPAFAGLFAPYWRDDARGLIIGLTAYNTKEHICRAALEATSFQVRQIIDAMKEDSGLNFTSLKVDGGLTANNLSMQFQSDILNLYLSRPKINETTAMGAAYAAGLAVGFWKNQNELVNIWQSSHDWLPRMETSRSDFLFKEWNRAIERSLGWIEKHHETVTIRSPSISEPNMLEPLISEKGIVVEDEEDVVSSPMMIPHSHHLHTSMQDDTVAVHRPVTSPEMTKELILDQVHHNRDVQTLKLVQEIKQREMYAEIIAASAVSISLGIIVGIVLSRTK